MVSHQRQKKTEVTMTLLTLVRLRVRLRGRTATHMVSTVKEKPWNYDPTMIEPRSTANRNKLKDLWLLRMGLKYRVKRWCLPQSDPVRCGPFGFDTLRLIEPKDNAKSLARTCG